MRRQMLRRLDDRDEAGFTLIELLVVIIIIGILAAIAVPVFLDQRQKAFDASAKSDLRNLAGFEEIYLNDYATYADGTDLLTKEPLMEVSSKDKMSILFNGGQGYCLSAQYTGSPHIYYYDSLAGGLQPSSATGCVTSTAGWTNGGTLG